ncbi:hypothetical protein QYZ88_003465 [Lachnospiraceae bacterium C1.1]|nr:hypothetical protein [Lachnospiraceae bacterium C1.1]
MKTWNEPSIEELMINETAQGGHISFVHDGYWSVDENGHRQEGTVMISGETE